MRFIEYDWRQLDKWAYDFGPFGRIYPILFSVSNTGQLKHIARLWAWFSVNNGHFGHKKEKFRYFTENITLKAYLWPSVTTFSIFMTINRSEAELQSTQNVNWNRFSG